MNDRACKQRTTMCSSIGRWFASDVEQEFLDSSFERSQNSSIETEQKQHTEPFKLLVERGLMMSLWKSQSNH